MKSFTDLKDTLHAKRNSHSDACLFGFLNRDVSDIADCSAAKEKYVISILQQGASMCCVGCQG